MQSQRNAQCKSTQHESNIATLHQEIIFHQGVLAEEMMQGLADVAGDEVTATRQNMLRIWSWKRTWPHNCTQVCYGQWPRVLKLMTKAKEGASVVAADGDSTLAKEVMCKAD